MLIYFLCSLIFFTSKILSFCPYNLEKYPETRFISSFLFQNTWHYSYFSENQLKSKIKHFQSNHITQFFILASKVEDTYLPAEEPDYPLPCFYTCSLKIIQSNCKMRARHRQFGFPFGTQFAPTFPKEQRTVDLQQ